MGTSPVPAVTLDSLMSLAIIMSWHLLSIIYRKLSFANNIFMKHYPLRYFPTPHCSNGLFSLLEIVGYLAGLRCLWVANDSWTISCLCFRVQRGEWTGLLSRRIQCWFHQGIVRSFSRSTRWFQDNIFCFHHSNAQTVSFRMAKWY